MLGAGCPRVTHPFAARAPSPKERASLDLHVLSTPPAFVLSQDQTLREGLLIRRATRFIDTESRRRVATLRLLITGSYELTVLCRSRGTELFARCTKGISKTLLRGGPSTRVLLYGTNFRHTVEFSRSGRTPSRPSRAVRGQPTKHYSGRLPTVKPHPRPLRAFVRIPVSTCSRGR